MINKLNLYRRIHHFIMPGQAKLTKFFSQNTSTEKLSCGSEVSPAKKRKTDSEENESQSSEIDEKARIMELNKLKAQIKLQHKATSLVPLDIGISWFKALKQDLLKESFTKLSKFVESQRRSRTVFPPEDEVWSWTNFVDINEVKVVILGQDPYHGVNQAHGLSFSVKKDIPAPPSLKNIFKELKSDIDDFTTPQHGNLIGWANQGVLMLNAVLTVRSGEPNSHKGEGWEKITDAVVNYINQQNSNVVFMLWGKDAQKKGASINKTKHCVLTTVHPSPLSASRGFLGCKHFSKANNYLETHGHEPIDWNDLPAPQ